MRLALRAVLCGVVAGAILTLPCPIQAQDTHQTLPSATSSTFNTTLQNYLRLEPANRTADATTNHGWVVANCLAASSGSKVLDAFACTAYTANGHYAAQASTGIDLGASPGPACANDDTALVVMADGLASPGGNFVQVGTSQYWVDCTTPTLPSPSNTVPLFFAFIASGVTTVVDTRPLAPTLPIRTQTHGEATIPTEQARWAGDEQPPYVTTGCLPTVPGASLTLAAFACSGYARASTGALRYITQGSSTLTLSGGNGLYWVMLYEDLTSTVSGWTRAVGTHYLWQIAASQPAEVAGGLLLFRATVAGGVITAISMDAPRRVTRAMTLAESVTTSARSPWVWAHGASVVTVAAGRTLTLGTCPQAGRWQIFDANGSSTGLVRFAGGACDFVYPEWWGIDPTGVTDSTTLWAQVIAAATARAPIHAFGRYRISATSPNAAITLIDRVQILGNYRHMQGGFAPGNYAVGGEFYFYGTGTAFAAPDQGGVSHNDIRLQDIFVYDVSGTGAIGINLDDIVGSFFDHVYTLGFSTGWQVTGNVYFGEFVFLVARAFRTRGFYAEASFNNTVLDISVASPEAAVTNGILLGTGSVTSHGARVNLKAENSFGVPISITQWQSIDGTIYIEQGTGTGSDAQLTLVRVLGGNLRVYILCNTNIPYGIAAFGGASGATEHNIRGLNLSGYVTGSCATNAALFYQSGDISGYWGVNIDGLHTDQEISGGALQVGQRIGANNYHTAHSTSPLVDQGRGSTVNSDDWQVGDVVWNTTASFPLLRRNTVAGNPGTWVGLHAHNATAITMTSTDATPSVAGASILVTNGTTNVTAIDDGSIGQLLYIRGNSAITFVDDNDFLQLAGNWVAGVGDTLTLLCTTGGAASRWWEIARSNN